MPLIYCVVFGVLRFSRYPTVCSLALGFELRACACVCVCVDGELEAILEGTYSHPYYEEEAPLVGKTGRKRRNKETR